jgi:hypothetical protein
LEDAPILEGQLGPSSPAGFGVDRDLDGDGDADVVLVYTSVDYWRYFLFLRGEDCLRWVGAVDAYQLRLLGKKRRGALRDLEGFTYPLQGSRFVKRLPPNLR